MSFRQTFKIFSLSTVRYFQSFILYLLLALSSIEERSVHFSCGNLMSLFQGNLVEHLRTHSGVKPHCCATCGKQFTHYSGLTQHLLTHSAVKKHCCNICGKAFRLASHHREHMRIHSGKT